MGELDVAEIRVGRRDGGFGVLRGAIEFDIRVREIVSDVVPDDGGGMGEVDAFLKRELGALLPVASELADRALSALVAGTKIRSAWRKT